LGVVIIRPPLVYGAAAPGNFQKILQLSLKSIPLPFGSVHNKRSMVYVENLVDFIFRCVEHPAAANQTFLISDNDDTSLARLITTIRQSAGMPKRLLPVPIFLFKLAGKLTGKQAVVDRLVGDLQVDSSKARILLNWQPPFTFEEGIAATVKHFQLQEK
jgi:nucleoside-diphosphate-sugar epimerase